MIIHLIAAARPNFMKIAPLWHALQSCEGLNAKIIHTGQHYDKNMSDTFFEDLDLPKPDFHLGVGSGTHAEQVGMVMIEYEKVLVMDAPDLVVVVGDVNATAACAITAKKHGVKVAHLEAGLRSNDMSMPEEINRKVTDAISDYLWTPSVDANENLAREGVDSDKIKLVGNIMIDSLCKSLPKIRENTLTEISDSEIDYAVVTFHRPSNVDDLENLTRVVNLVNHIASKITVYFPMHPRTKKMLVNHGLFESFGAGVFIMGPLSYIDFMKLVIDSKMILTDSGGIQEEATYLKKPCITIRDNTERPITVIEGTNTLADATSAKIHIDEIIDGSYKAGHVPVLWDGDTALRIVHEINKINQL